MKLPIVLSHFQVGPLLAKLDVGIESEISPDLGLATVQVLMEEEGIRFPDGELLLWDVAEQIVASRVNCFVLQNGVATKVTAFSERTNRVYSLMPTKEAPTLLISGLPMHRIKDTTPNRDTEEKIKAIKPVVGEVLDTATGLGYTAIEASKTANKVTSIEHDPEVLEIARKNPWSVALFESNNITQLIGDSFDILLEQGSDRYSAIIHDPPTFSLAGHLYSKEFYESLHRVLRAKGRLFHYIGNPNSRSGRSMTRGVIRRLRESGFSKIRRAPQAFGVIAQK